MNIKDFKWTEKRFGTRFAKILKGLGFSDQNVEDIKVTDANGNVKTLVTDSNFSSLLAKNGLIEVTWQDLKDKRDNGELIPGSLYRITDYQCTTTQENTRSAGHQFDIVLLALSENKLAEEGWAMMHDNIYDVTFEDGVTKKCYLYCTSVEDNFWNIVEVGTMLGWDEAQNIEIDETTKTASVQLEYGDGGYAENLPYNYFQNSNLSAWKVWYCLDNDKSRFAWADDNKAFTISYQGEDYQMVRDTSNDVQGLYAWSNDDIGTLYTNNETPQIGDNLYWQDGTLAEENELTKGIHFNGRGVIYRLIDEFNNDCPYDFKNIQFIRKLDGGQIAQQGTATYCYTFTLYDRSNLEYKDASIFAINYKNDENGITPCYNNKIEAIDAYNGLDNNNHDIYSLVLPNIICIGEVEEHDTGWGIYGNIMRGSLFTINNDFCLNNIYSYVSRVYANHTSTLIYYNKQVIFEEI